MHTFQVTYADDPTTVLFQDFSGDPVVTREKCRRVAQERANRERRPFIVHWVGTDERIMVEPA